MISLSTRLFKMSLFIVSITSISSSKLSRFYWGYYQKTMSVLINIVLFFYPPKIIKKLSAKRYEPFIQFLSFLGSFFTLFPLFHQFMFIWKVIKTHLVCLLCVVKKTRPSEATKKLKKCLNHPSTVSSFCWLSLRWLTNKKSLKLITTILVNFDLKMIIIVTACVAKFCQLLFPKFWYNQIVLQCKLIINVFYIWKEKTFV